MEMKYKGLTVNERLYISGLLNEFDRAVEEKSIVEIISILKIVELDDRSIKSILESKNLI